MRQRFESQVRLLISPGAPSATESGIEVSGLMGTIRDINVGVEIQHTWTGDLRLTLVSPDGGSTLLVDQTGGRGQNFNGTAFDDAAPFPIQAQQAPFRGTFRPVQPLDRFNGKQPTGRWTLRIEDQASQDGGALKSWWIEIETGGNIYEQRTPVAIDPNRPGTVRSSVGVQGMGALVARTVSLSLDLRHTWIGDLRLSLEAPDGRSVLLTERRGGSGDDFNHTEFSDVAPRAIASGMAPFTGAFRPEQPLEGLRGCPVNGTWTLRVEDQEPGDGGELRGWRLVLDTMPAEPNAVSAFEIKVKFVGGLNASQRSVFQLAAARWREVIVGALPETTIDGEVTRGVHISAEGTQIDGDGGVLGQAGPTRIRRDSNLPAAGVMSFDTSDLAEMERDGSLVDVIIHEMGHVLGLGTLWERMGLLEGAGTTDPTFRGTRAKQEYQRLTGSAPPRGVPVENDGGPGTRDGHWRETTFDNELMTGFIDRGDNPLSRLTLAALADMGYQVNDEVADDYRLPAALRGFLSVASTHPRRRCMVDAPPLEYID